MSEINNANQMASINPDFIIKKLHLGGDGNSGDTGGDKQRRQLRQELEGMKKKDRIKWLREHFSQDPIWTDLNL